MPFDLHNYIRELDVNTEEFRVLISSISERELACSPTQGWNILQVLEHVLVTERVVLMMLGRPATNRGSSLEQVGDNFLEGFLKDRVNRKFKAPETLEPKGKIKNSDQFLSSLSAQREKLKDNLNSGNLLVDERLYKHLIIGEMSVSDWLYFLIRHSQRHIDQIFEIRSHLV